LQWALSRRVHPAGTTRRAYASSLLFAKLLNRKQMVGIGVETASVSVFFGLYGGLHASFIALKFRFFLFLSWRHGATGRTRASARQKVRSNQKAANLQRRKVGASEAITNFIFLTEEDILQDSLSSS
jgi:hypothetical protein